MSMSVTPVSSAFFVFGDGEGTPPPTNAGNASASPNVTNLSDVQGTASPSVTNLSDVHGTASPSVTNLSD
jgi:hypothetical protein